MPLIHKLGLSKYAKDNQPKEEVIYDTSTLLNPHLLCVGGTGVGKSFQMQKLTESVAKAPQLQRIRLIDIHGDIEIPGASRVKFSANTPYGLNPLTISSNPDYGGVLKRVKGFTSLLRRINRTLGDRQAAVLENLLLDMYIAYGYYPDDPETWSADVDKRRDPQTPKRNPTIDDLRTYTYNKLGQLIFGTAQPGVSSLERTIRNMGRLVDGVKKIQKGDNTDLDALKAKTIEEFMTYVHNIETGMERADLIKYDGKSVVHSIFDRIDSLNKVGVFKSETPPFDPAAKVWIYDIKALSRPDQVMFVDTLAESVLTAALERGRQRDVIDVLALDEAKAWFSDEPDHVLNVMGREIRKFGTALWFFSQSPEHFPADIYTNCGTKLVLGLDESHWKASAAKMQIDVSKFRFIKPKQTALVSLKREGEFSNKVMEIELPSYEVA